MSPQRYLPVLTGGCSPGLNAFRSCKLESFSLDAAGRKQETERLAPRSEYFYQQEYCGCVYSLRDSNRWRKDQGRERIKICEKYYGQTEEQK
uniref:hypothetical protein n=1 Tax=Collimonas humicola TaxID=2825886 RepID=UPI001B8CF5BE|nr:hypothetical protein [Collimonas humicola]